MTGHQKTLKLVTNLDRAAVEAKLAEVRGAAQAAGLAELAAALQGVEGMSRAELETRVRGALKGLADKPQHGDLFAQLELVELNLPNLK